MTMEEKILNLKSRIEYCLSQILWMQSFSLIYVHIGAVYGTYLCITSAKWQTIVMTYILGKHFHHILVFKNFNFNYM